MPRQALYHDIEELFQYIRQFIDNLENKTDTIQSLTHKHFASSEQQYSNNNNNNERNKKITRKTSLSMIYNCH